MQLQQHKMQLQGWSIAAFSKRGYSSSGGAVFFINAAQSFICSRILQKHGLKMRFFVVQGAYCRKSKQLKYANAIGNMMYIKHCTRPSITLAVSRLSRYICNLSIDY